MKNKEVERVSVDTLSKGLAGMRKRVRVEEEDRTAGQRVV